MKIEITVTPNAKQAEVTEGATGYRVKVDASPREGKANRRVVEILARHFKVPKSAVKIVKGEKSRHKTVEIV